MAHLIESSTGLPMPYVIPAGYSLEMVEKDWDSSENMGFWLFFDGFPAAAAGQNQANTLTGINTVVSYNTLWFDPTSALPHTIDMLVENFDPMNALEGGISFPTLLTERGTPPLPAVKTVRCHHCGKNIPGVPRFQDNVVCPHCAGQILLITPRPPTARKGA
jgi:DNA-directed RNA polymerase subunit RPC12/RpoP